MALIDSTYFINDISLPGNALSGAREDISQYLDKYQKQVLISLLGYPLWKLVQAEIDAEVYTNYNGLVNGEEYDVEYLGETTTVKWNGLKNSDLVSLIAYYVYYFYMKDHVTHTTGIGESVSEKENAVSISPVRKMVDAWNHFCDLYGSINDCDIVPSAYNYLYEKDYDGWLFTSLDKQNVFSL